MSGRWKIGGKPQWEGMKLFKKTHTLELYFNNSRTSVSACLHFEDESKGNRETVSLWVPTPGFKNTKFNKFVWVQKMRSYWMQVCCSDGFKFFQKSSFKMKDWFSGRKYLVCPQWISIKMTMISRQSFKSNHRGWFIVNPLKTINMTAEVKST